MSARERTTSLWSVLRDWRAGMELLAATTPEQRRPRETNVKVWPRGGAVDIIEPGSNSPDEGEQSWTVGWELDRGVPKVILGQLGGDGTAVVWLLEGGRLVVDGAGGDFVLVCGRGEFGVRRRHQVEGLPA